MKWLICVVSLPGGGRFLQRGILKHLNFRMIKNVCLRVEAIG